MNSHRQLGVVGTVFIAAILVQCNGTSTGNGDPSSPNMPMRRMDMGGGDNLTTILPNEESGPVSFANDVQPVFDMHCIDCHNPIRPLAGLDLTADNSYDMLVSHAVSTPCRNDLGQDAVRVQPCDTPPCDPSQSQLWSKTMPDVRAPDGTRCLNPMPFGTPGLGVICPPEFALIEQWIIDGAPNN